ncbi:hypothetical protein ASZ78_012390 [Callipepla squamata]|uniref:Uncharacterized protein n=1 Tax=Callipepla squamata TaxID=9009 RepID=A0A226MWX9_CALSU|nr:hypothetical protein ASZ78_012390 [Callipepla squamata]
MFLRNTVWLPFYLASDMIIDMITELQASNSLKTMEPEGDFCIPSCLGGITDENGGSNLHPQSPLDDVNVVDLKWICNLIFKTLELLYQMKKWEALVHIAVQFNVLTHERYTEQVSPLLVYAQRQLLERIQQLSGPNNHESHFTKYTFNNANKMSCRNYIGQNLQLPVPPSASVLVFPGCFAYPEMENDYAEILEINNQRDLKVQALHELGNLHFFAGNKRYIITSNVRLRTKYCYFSAMLFKTLFRASLPHPTFDCEFAQYEIHTLVPGLDLFSDRYRADICTVIASLNFLMFELHCAKQNLTHKWNSSGILACGSESASVIFSQIKVLTDIGFFTEAFHELCLLNCGERIPWKIPSGYKKNEEMKASLNFDSSKSLLSFRNLQVLEDIFNWGLSLTTVPLCNQQIMNKLILAKMHFIICLSATINNIPEKVEKRIYSVVNNPDEIAPSNAKVDAVKNSRQQEQRGTVMQLVDCKDELNMTMLKGILLTEAEENLSHLVQSMQDKYGGKISQCSAEDLEVLIEAKLELAAISQQWHQAAFSVALAFSAIRLLQDADIFRMKATRFQEKKDKRESLDSCVEDAQLPHSTIAQDHLNIHLWLRCRKMLVAALVTLMHSIGDKKENYVSERRSIIKEVILEAEAFGDIETQAEMMVQAAILDLQEGCPMADIKLLLQIFFCGEYIEEQIEDSTLTCLVLPAKNIYLPYINLLAQVKMRIGKKNVSEAVVASQRLIAMESIKEQNVKDVVQQKIPEFASMDLLASYRDYLSGMILYLAILKY